MPWDKEKALYKLQVFEVLLYHASEEGKEHLPSMWQAISLEIVISLVEYLGGDTVSVPRWQSALTPLGWNWQTQVNEVVTRALESNQNKINPALAEALKDLLEFKWKAERGESWCENQIRHLMMDMEKGFKSTFSLTVPFVENILNKVLSKLDEDTKKHCQAIGELMRPHIKKDLQYTAENFHW